MAVPSQHPNMGAIPFPGGVTFRVWAPFADEVWVQGDFNNWQEFEIGLGSEGNGYWSCDVGNATAGQKYLFKLRSQGRTFDKIDPYAKSATHSAGDGIIVNTGFDWGADSFQLAPWNELVIYELHAGTFLDQQGGGPGHVEGIIEKLSYLRDLGVNTLLLMPSMEFTGDFSLGYNPELIFAVEGSYGGPDALKRVIKACHESGIGVLLDVVYNHFGPVDGGSMSKCLWQFDGWSQNFAGGIYFYQDDRRFTPWGERPDYGRQEVVSFIRDNVHTWLEEFRFDGLRFDATSFIRRMRGESGDIPEGWYLMQNLNGSIKQSVPWKMTMAEDGRGERAITRPGWESGAGFDTQWDFSFQDHVRNVMKSPADEGRDLNRLRDAVLNRIDSDAFKSIIYVESHDQVQGFGNARLPSQIDWFTPGGWAVKKRVGLAAAALFTTPGIPLLFQGSEFLETGIFQDTVPLDWAKTFWFSGMVNMHRDLIRLRRNWFNNTRGLRGQNVRVTAMNQDAKVIVYHRWDQGGAGDDCIVILNCANRAYSDYRIGVPQEGFWRVRFNSDIRDYSPDFANWGAFDAWSSPAALDGFNYSISISLGAYTALILSL